MVLIIRNNRIFSSRQSRIKKPLVYVKNSQERQYPGGTTFNRDIEASVMSLVAVLGTLFLYSIAMFTLPFAAFFGVEHVMSKELHVERFTTNCISVFAAVVTVNLIISCYAYQALYEVEPNNDSGEKEIVNYPSKDSLDKKVD